MKKIRRDLHKVLGFTQNMLQMGMTPSTQVISKKIQPAGDFVVQSLGIEKDAMVARLERLRLADREPMMFETRYIRMDLFPGVLKQDLSGSLWTVFERVYQYKPIRHSQRIKIGKITAEKATLLGIRSGANVFLIKVVTYAAGDLPLDCVESFYRSDRYELSFDAFVD